MLILSSNTVFIQGKTLKGFIQNLGIDFYFDQFNFSDELKVAKPNKLMYSNSNFHIGDNHNTDYVGAKQAGCTPILINSNFNFNTIKDAYNNIINQER